VSSAAAFRRIKSIADENSKYRTLTARGMNSNVATPHGRRRRYHLALFTAASITHGRRERESVFHSCYINLSSKYTEVTVTSLRRSENPRGSRRLEGGSISVLQMTFKLARKILKPQTEAYTRCTASVQIENFNRQYKRRI
jgi:hypothetical protein